MNEQLLTKNQIKTLLNISIGKLNDMMKKNEIPYYKIGKCVRFDSKIIQNKLEVLEN